jgi:hypothetical protein
MSSAGAFDHEELLGSAWQAAGTTAIELPPVDVNQVLHDRYHVDDDFVFTRTMLWDMEVRKASRPDVYIPTVVRPGSAEKFPGTTNGQFEDFTRASDQRLWLKQSTYGMVIEHVRLDHDGHRAFFIGVEKFVTPDGRTLRASVGQPIFHVEHSVAGAEDRPLNLWRIAHLTEHEDPEMKAYFEEMGRDPYLRVFIEVYLREDLGLDMKRKQTR